MSSDVHAKWMNSEARAISGDVGKALLQPVLHRLDVVVGRPLDRLDACGVGRRERVHRVVDRAPRLRRERRELGHRGLVGERHEPRELDAHAMAHEPEFGEVRRQRRDLGRHSGRRAATARSAHERPRSQLGSALRCSSGVDRLRRSWVDRVHRRCDFIMRGRRRRSCALAMLYFFSRRADAIRAQASRHDDQSLRPQGPHRACREEDRVPADGALAVDRRQPGPRIRVRSARFRCSSSTTARIFTTRGSSSSTSTP